MQGFQVGKGLRQFNSSMGTTIEIDDSYVCQANHTHHSSNIVGVVTREEFDELKKEINYMKDFLIYKQVTVDENEFKEFVESRKVAQKLLDASKPKGTGLNAELLDGLHAISFYAHTHSTSALTNNFVYAPYLPLINDPNKENK